MFAQFSRVPGGHQDGCTDERSGYQRQIDGFHNNGAYSHSIDKHGLLNSLQTITYIEKIPVVQSAVESALYALGDGNWKMGEGVQVGKGNKEDDDSSITEHFVRKCQHLSSMLTS